MIMNAYSLTRNRRTAIGIIVIATVIMLSSSLPAGARGVSIYERYMDSLRSLRSEIYSSTSADSLRKPVLSAYSCYRLFAPATFYYAIAADKLLLWRGDNDGDDERQTVDDALLRLYLQHPELVAGTEKSLRHASEIDEEIEEPIHHDVDYAEIGGEMPTDSVDVAVEVVVAKPKFWTVSGDYYLQFLQNYISSNWYKGGESSYSMVASATMQANYNSLKGIKFDNKLELKLGFQTAKSDSLHSFLTSEDLIRYTGKFGIQATKRWYYTLQLIAYTQFMRGYKSNDEYVYSDFFSPFNANLSLGMDYTVSLFKDKLTGTIQLAPIAYNFKYVGRHELAEDYGLDAGDRQLHELGSGITADLTWQFLDNIKWVTRLYYYTTYSRTELEWENTLTFQFSKYISSNIFVYPRFDDSTDRDDHHGYWQLKEYASFGVTYAF